MFYITAAIISLTPIIFSTRLMLYESTVKLISVPTFASPLIRKYPWFIPRFIVPNGCSTNEPRSFIFSGLPPSLSAIRSSTASSITRLMVRPRLFSVHRERAAHLLQAVVLLSLQRAFSLTRGEAVGQLRPFRASVSVGRSIITEVIFGKQLLLQLR